MAQKRKKKSKRSQTKFPALDPKLNLKSRIELIDYDYLDQLSEKDKAWLNKFTEEYVNANLNRKNPRKNLHKTKKLKQDCDRRNNLRNVDVWTMTKAQGKGLNLEEAFNSEEKMNEALEEMKELGNNSNYRSKRGDKL